MRLMSANSPQQRCPTVGYPIAGVALQLLVIEHVLSFDTARGSCDELMTSHSIGQEGRSLFFCLYFGHRGNLTGMRRSFYVLKKLNF